MKEPLSLFHVYDASDIKSLRIQPVSVGLNLFSGPILYLTEVRQKWGKSWGIPVILAEVYRYDPEVTATVDEPS